MRSIDFKQRLSIGIKFFVASGLTRALIASIILLFLWIAIFWSSLLP